MTDNDGANMVAEAIARFRATMAPLLEACTGYRNECLRAGMSNDAASAMAADFHHMVTASITKPSRS